MLTNYKTQCESKVKKWIEDTTGKEGFKHLSKDKFENLSLEDYQEFVVDCKVEVGHTLNAEYTEEEVVAGSTDKEGEFVSSKEEYEKAIKRYLNEDLNNPTHFQSLVSKIEQGTYAQHSEKSTITNGQTILYKHTCHTCNGNSEQKCTECKGQGEVRCSQCAGKGEYRCSSCNGRGEVKCKECEGYGKERCRRCEGRGKVTLYNFRTHTHGEPHLCSKCNGTGITGACRSCQGKGTVWCNYCKGGMKECYKCSRTGYMKCPSCDGKAIITCKTCKGTNQITEIAQIELTMTPKYTTNCPENIDEQTKQVIDKYITSNNTDIANITRTELRQDESQKRVVEIYQIQIPFAKFNVSFEGKKFAWFIYGKNLEVESEQENTLQAFKDYEFKQESQKLEKDADALVEIAEKSSFLDLSIIKKSQPVVANLMNSEINQSIIQADIDDTSSTYEDRINSIQSKLDTPLSKDYIEKVVEALDTIADCFSRSVTLTTLGLAFAVSFIVAVAFFMPFFVNIFSTAAIFAIFIQLGIKHKAKVVAKWWGQKLFLWVRMLGYTNIRFARLYVIIGVIVVYFTSSYINETKLKQMSVSTSTTKQTKQPRQSTPPQEQKPALVMPKCDDKQMLNDVINYHKNQIREGLELNPNEWANIKDKAKARGVELTSVDKYINSISFEYLSVETTKRNKANYQVECVARARLSNSTLQHTKIWIWQYLVQATEQGRDVAITKYDFLDENVNASSAQNTPKASNESQSVTQNAPSDESKNANSTQSAQSKNIQASFDCAKANTRVEKLICADEELANLDIELSRAYANARNSLDNEGKKTLLSEQKKWLENYNQCDDKPCVLHNLRKRIRALKVYDE